MMAQFDDYDPVKMLSNPGISTELSDTLPRDILVTDFFGGVAGVEVTSQSDELEARGLPSRWALAKRTQRKTEDDAFIRRSRPTPPTVPSVGMLKQSVREKEQESMLGSGVAAALCAVVIILTVRTIMNVT